MTTTQAIPAIMEVIDISYVGTCNDYVYDLETEDGTYLGGDDILLKNTDSCMIKFNVPVAEYKDENGVVDMNKYMKKHFELAQETANKITKVFKNPIKLEFEKVMFPYFLLQKKRYIYIERRMCEDHGCVMIGDESELIPMCKKCKIAHTIPNTVENVLDTKIKELEHAIDDDYDIIDDTVDYEEECGDGNDNVSDNICEIDSDTIDTVDVINYKGISIARRDGCAYVKKIYLELLKIAMLEFIPGSEQIAINKAVNYASTCMKQLINGQVDKKLLYLSKSLKGSYKVRTKYKGTIAKTEKQKNAEIKDLSISIKWDNAFCTWCQEECPDPEFGDKKCRSCKKCTILNKCVNCMHCIVTVTSAHVYVAKVLKKMNPSDHLRPPSRVPFIFIEKKGSDKNTKQCEMVCHPDHMLGKKLDYMYYFEHQMKEPICQILNLLLANAGTSSKDCEKYYNDAVQEAIRSKTGTRSMASAFKKVQR